MVTGTWQDCKSGGSGDAQMVLGQSWALLGIETSQAAWECVVGWRLSLHRTWGGVRVRMGAIYGRIGWCLAASFVLVVCQSSLSACPHLCQSVVLRGQPTCFPREQQVSTEQQAGQQMVQGQQGRVTSVSIKLSPVAPGGTGSRCQFLLRVLLAVPAAISARCKPRFFPMCAHPWEHAGHRGFTSRVGTSFLESCRLTSADGDGEYPPALCGDGKLWESGAQQRVQ